MHEGISVNSERKIDLPETVYTEYGGIELEGNQARVVSPDGTESLPISAETASVISLALRAQEKVFTGAYPQLEKRLSVLNCRKAVFASTGLMTVREATDTDRKDINGLGPLFKDVERLQESGYLAYIIKDSGAEVSEILSNYTGTFPCVVHMFDVDEGSETDFAVEFDTHMDDGRISPEVISSLHRMHSFLVLGKSEGDFLCFQKMGPALDQPFMVSNLADILTLYSLEKDKKGLVFVGPAS